jgi:hypothetical protein
VPPLLLQVLQVVQLLLPKLQLDKLPLYALGSANGGAFALTLPMFMQLAGGWLRALASCHFVLEAPTAPTAEFHPFHPSSIASSTPC